MPIRNKRIGKIRFDKTNVDAPTINRALDNIIDNLNNTQSEIIDAVNSIETSGAPITIDPQGAAAVTSNRFNLEGAGGITFASNAFTDTITIIQSPPPPQSIELIAQTGSISGSTFNIIAEGCCIHTETSGSDTLIISSSAPCEFTATGSSNLTIQIPQQIVIVGGNPNTIVLGHFDSAPTFTNDSGMVGVYGGIGYYTGVGIGFDGTQSKFGSGSMGSIGNVGGNNGLQVQTLAATGALGTPYFQNADGLTGDFTFEFWVKPTYTTTFGFQGLAQIAGPTSPNLSLWMYLGELHFGLTGGAVATGVFLTAGVWQAIAICRSGSTIRLFVDGTLVYTTPLLNLGSGANTLILGYTSDMAPFFGSAEGFYDEMRFSDVALYTASYTPATASFGNYAGVATLVVDNCARQFSLNQNVSITSLTASSAVSASQLIGNQLTASNGQITTLGGTNLTYTNGTITNLTASNASGSNLTYGNGNFTTLTGSNISGSSLTYDNGYFTNLTASVITASSNIISPAITGSEISSSNFIGWGNRIVRPYLAACDLTTQTASATTAAYPMTFDTTEEAIGISIVSGSRITFAYDGTYNIQFSSQITKTNASSAEIDIWLRESGSNVPRSNTEVFIQGNNASSVAAWNWVRTFPSGSYAEIMWRTSDTDVELITYPSASSPDRPEVPSVILSVSQV